MQDAPSPMPRRARGPLRFAALLALPMMLVAAACNPVDTVADWFGLGSNEVATPQFPVTNGITLQAWVQFPDDLDGTKVTVRLRCSGGTSLTQTIIIHDTGDFATGGTTFADDGWSGVDCLVSQEIVAGVEVVRAVVATLGGGDILRGQFFNL